MFISHRDVHRLVSSFTKRNQIAKVLIWPCCNSFLNSSRFASDDGKNKNKISSTNLENLSKDEIILIVHKLESRNAQLKNILQNKVNPCDAGDDEIIERKRNFANYPKRHILLRVSYLGWNYKGYVAQENTSETIEHHLFKALKEVFLIESRQTSNYNQCGRTDKGVSACEQVISIDVRSNVKPGEQLTAAGINSEINYCSLLNKVLPNPIRAICWRPLASQTYSARFDCVDRTYKYFLPRGNLNIDKMRQACEYLVGTHDFRNFCKPDIRNPHHIRRLDSVQIEVQSKNHERFEEFDMLCLEIKGLSFLWHMIRSIVSILTLVGQQRESPEIVKELLDVKSNDQKPMFVLANEIPLNLFRCNFRKEKGIDTKLLKTWIYDEKALRDVIQNLQVNWSKEAAKSAMIYEMQKVLSQEYSSQFPDMPKVPLRKEPRAGRHRKLLQR